MRYAGPGEGSDWRGMRSRVVVRDPPFAWGYIGAGVLLAIGIAAVFQADKGGSRG